ncbi:MAG: BLUF domain-containing protein [Methylicorpusculum sp.]|uniref:BLUF domain-containing protein n=1 Tax=Methylicorpusculum sp. TaxID=2713644 RepID=UPI00271CB4A5|nr:BLUF domain-containing protein [Methylicorpusculum sp.]MDO8937992.1 BLUF domain-containing protein [Methylicorpusculum sp.]MDO9241208.1 BLUF domain-containing protein [Methylicorpusculum sp.]MDP2177767.1 BLUF domain-containing protein [Methylicorpusculum sp.]MDP2202803.1 BLUF domain-containing protein [Methylicorpusculum sp.]MDP3530894.1 BLUF domain-containing protein [Methylicorpusculum sp.]
MFHLVYVSSAIKPLSKSDLLDLLIQSRENNTKKGISGMLLYKDGNFMQVLEGEESAVRSLFEVIIRDSRHRGSIVLLEEHISEPFFKDWSMGFRDLTDENLHATAGYSQFINSPLDANSFKSKPHACLDLLYLFSKSC